jgi:hypothetical protein
MFDLVIGAVFAIGGVIALTSSSKLSAFEKRLADAHSWTRVTGWAATRKGVLAWRGVGILFVLCGAIWILDGLLLLKSLR